MKKRIFALLTVLALAIAALVPAGIAEEVEVSTDPFEEMTAEFAQARSVTPYQIIVNPTRVTGWGNMRWAPSKSAMVMANYPAKAELTVISETPNWFQAQDPATGLVGFIDREHTAAPGELKEEKALNPTVEENGKTNLGVIDINGAFSLQCKLADGYTIQPLKSTSDQMIARVSSEDPSKPMLQLAVAYDENYGTVERLNDLDDEALAVLEKTFTDVDPTVEITYGDTGFGTRLMIVRMNDNGMNYVDFMSIYKGYFVECVLVPANYATGVELTEEQIQMCVDFLTEMDFVPAEEADAAEKIKGGKYVTNLTDYDPETNSVTAQVMHSVPLDAAAAESLQVGDTLTVGSYTEEIETLEKTEEGDIIINEVTELRKYGDSYLLYLYEEPVLEPFTVLTLTIPDELVFMDGIDPETGEMLEEPLQKTAEDLKELLASDSGIGFSTDHTWVQFGEDGGMVEVEREYSPQQ